MYTPTETYHYAFNCRSGSQVLGRIDIVAWALPSAVYRTDIHTRISLGIAYLRMVARHFFNEVSAARRNRGM